MRAKVARQPKSRRLSQTYLPQNLIITENNDRLSLIIMNTNSLTPNKDLTTKLINGLLSIKPLASFARTKAREMIIKRANLIGVNWHENVDELKKHDWQPQIAEVEDKNCDYPEYYLTSFHGYDTGNLSWEAAWELESASYSVHSTIYSKTPSVDGDATLRNRYHQVLQSEITQPPQKILDIGCSVGLSTFALNKIYPESQITGLDLSPYFLAVANYQTKEKNLSNQINWIHAPAEATKLPAQSYDLVSASLIFHELPQSAAKNIITHASELLNSGGYFAMIDMNPRSEIYQKMPRYVFTLLKSTEPYLDQYFSLDIESALIEAGFETPKVVSISVRHRVIIARKK